MFVYICVYVCVFTICWQSKETAYSVLKMDREAPPGLPLSLTWCDSLCVWDGVLNPVTERNILYVYMYIHLYSVYEIARVSQNVQYGDMC